MARNRYHVISTETELLYRTRDIYDELQMLRSLADDQDVVWQQAFFSKGAEGNFQHYHSCTPVDVKKDLDDMLSGTEQTTNNVRLRSNLKHGLWTDLANTEKNRSTLCWICDRRNTVAYRPMGQRRCPILYWSSPSSLLYSYVVTLQGIKMTIPDVI